MSSNSKLEFCTPNFKVNSPSLANTNCPIGPYQQDSFSLANILAKGFISIRIGCKFPLMVRCSGKYLRKVNNIETF